MNTTTIDLEKIFDNAQTMHLQEFINNYASLQTPSNEKYWRERCEAAEYLISPDAFKMLPEAWRKWRELKSTPIPIQTPCGWVKADDVLAPDCVVVLACIDDEDEPIMAYLSHEVGKWYGVHASSKYIETPSHWMPLPNKPNL